MAHATMYAILIGAGIMNSWEFFLQRFYAKKVKIPKRYL
jgi:hypothetical protein